MRGFQSHWSKLALEQKLIVGVAIGAVAYGLFSLSQSVGENYTTLYDNMNKDDAQSVAARLTAQKVQFKMDKDGSRILVPSKDKDRLTLESIQDVQGQIRLDQIPPVVQGDVQKAWLEEKTVQSIVGILKSIQGINNAQVIVSRPEHSVFIDNEDPVTASVMLEVDQGFRLREEQIKTIRHLVSHSVPGLKPENVTIADNFGTPLDNMSASGVSTETDSKQKSFEDKVAKKVMAILIPLVGKENVQVSVTALLNFDQAESEIQRVIPSGGTADMPTGLAVSNQTQTEEYQGGAPKPVGGEAGVESNVPSYQGESGDKKSGSYKSTKTTTNYESSKEHKKVIYAPGTVERMTVAVVLNKVLTAKETEEIQELVENAAGVDPARGDAVSIKGYQFSEKPVDKDKQLSEASDKARQNAFYIQLASIGVILLLGVAALGVFYSLFKKPAEGEIVEEVEQYVYEEPEQLLPEAPIPMIEAKLDPEMEHMRESINNMIVEDPSEAARVLVTYMKEM